MPDSYETIVRWYLRFNGYLGVENFVVHEPQNGRVNQGAETDILAVRFAHSREQAGAPMQSDPRLASQISGGVDADFVIAEVKGGNRARLNDLWTPPTSDVKAQRVGYLLRWLGPLPDDTSIGEVAKDLQTRYCASFGSYSFRLVFFSKKPRRQVSALGISQITFHDIADFFVNVRAGSWTRYGLGSRSDHDQWDPLVLDAWRLADPDRNAPPEAKIRDVLSLLERSRAFSARRPRQTRAGND